MQYYKEPKERNWEKRREERKNKSHLGSFLTVEIYLLDIYNAWLKWLLLRIRWAFMNKSVFLFILPRYSSVKNISNVRDEIFLLNAVEYKSVYCEFIYRQALYFKVIYQIYFHGKTIAFHLHTFVFSNVFFLYCFRKTSALIKT